MGALSNRPSFDSAGPLNLRPRDLSLLLLSFGNFCVPSVARRDLFVVLSAGEIDAHVGWLVNLENARGLGVGRNFAGKIRTGRDSGVWSKTYMLLVYP